MTRNTGDQWLAEAKAKAGDDALYPSFVAMAKVKVFFKPYKALYGDFAWMRLDKALTGEKRKLWEIVDVFGEQTSGDPIEKGV